MVMEREMRLKLTAEASSSMRSCFSEIEGSIATDIVATSIHVYSVYTLKYACVGRADIIIIILRMRS